jgi:hypothetical protein
MKRIVVFETNVQLREKYVFAGRWDKTGDDT